MKKHLNRRDFIKKAGSGLLYVAVAPTVLSSMPALRGTVFAAPVSNPTYSYLLSADVCQGAIRKAMSRNADFSDIFVERTEKRVIKLREGKISSIRFSIDQGVGIRVQYGEKTGFAFCEDFDEDNINKTAIQAAELGKNAKQVQCRDIRGKISGKNVIPQAFPLEKIPEDDRIAMMRRAEKAARAESPLIKEVDISYFEEVRHITIANSMGVFTADVQPLIYFVVSALATKGDRRHQGSSRLSARSGFELFDKTSPEKVAKQAVNEAVVMIDAVESPSGEMPVVVAGGWGGVLFHEAVGHGLEGDAISRDSSFFCGKQGQRVASDIVTFVDDATLLNLRGSYNVDDEGTPSQRKVLIEKGILKQYMMDIQSGRRLKTVTTGNGRRESFRFAPMVRMTNTFILEGQSTPEEIIAATPKGIFAADFDGGVVDTASGNFTFTVRAAYLIEDGKLTRPIKRATLIGTGSDALKSIDMVGNDLAFGPGTCGKGQWVPVTSGQPTIRLSKIVVGGTKA